MPPDNSESSSAPAAAATAPATATATATALAPVDQSNDQHQASTNVNSDDEEFPVRKNSAHEREIAIALNAVNAKEAPLPYDDDAPPLPDEAPPEDDGWEYLWDSAAYRYYFYNRLTGKSQWENPRQPEATASYIGSYDRYANSTTAATTATSEAPAPKRKYNGYNPAIHGNYDPNADYAREAEEEEEEVAAAATGLPGPSTGDYTTAAHFNRFTGRFQQAGVNPELHNDENKSKRQMNAFFDVDAAANSHDGRSLKAERRGKSLSKKELKAFQEKRKAKKEVKRRAWLLD